MVTTTDGATTDNVFVTMLVSVQYQVQEDQVYTGTICHQISQFTVQISFLQAVQSKSTDHCLCICKFVCQSAGTPFNLDTGWLYQIRLAFADVFACSCASFCTQDRIR